MLRPSLRATSAVASAALLCAAAPAGAAQIAPNVIFIEEGERGGELSVWNHGDTPIEIEVTLAFGYEDTNDEGEVHAVHRDADDDHPRSAASWLRAYPRRTVVPPESRQSVRIFSREPADLEDGEYWARAEVRSRPTEVEGQELEGEDDIAVEVGVATRHRLPVFVRRGEPEAYLGLRDVELGIEEVPAEDNETEDGAGGGERRVVARYRAEVRGNAAFLGTLRARVETAEGVVAEGDQRLAVFVPGARRVHIPIPDELGDEELAGARVILEGEREHPLLRSSQLVGGRAERWEGSL